MNDSMDAGQENGSIRGDDFCSQPIGGMGVTAIQAFVCDLRVGMNVAEVLLYDIDTLAKKLSDKFGSLSYNTFVEDMSTIESAIIGFLVMQEGWMSLPATMQQELLPIDWHAGTGRWNPHERRHVGFDPRKLWETIVQKLPELRKMTQELLKGDGEPGQACCHGARQSTADPGVDYETALGGTA